MSQTTSDREESRSPLRNAWEFVEPFGCYLLLAAVLLIGLLLLVRFLGLEPPDTFTIATGREGGAYYAFAQQYLPPSESEGGEILKVICDISGEPYVDHEKAVRAWMALD